MTDIECKHTNWTSYEYGNKEHKQPCDMYEAYCNECNQYFHMITKEIIEHPSKYSDIIK